MMNMQQQIRNEKYDAAFSLLKCALIFQLVGFLMESFFFGSAIGKFFWLKLEMSDNLAFQIDKGIVLAAFLIAVFSIFKSSFISYFFIFSFCFFRAFCMFYNGGSISSDITFFTQMARYTLPLGIAMSCLSQAKLPAASKILKLAIAVTFIAHGYEALCLHPKFTDFLIKTFRVYLGLVLTEEKTHFMLYVIGAVDILAAMSLILTNSRWSTSYMVFWGALTALCRVMYDSNNGLADTLDRVSHFAIPLALYLLYHTKQSVLHKVKVRS